MSIGRPVGRSGLPSTARPAALLAVLVAVLLATAGCGLRGEADARVLSVEEAPPALLSPSPVVLPLPAPAGASAQELVFVRESRLVPVTRPVLDVTPQRALQDLLGGPTPAERAVGLSTALPAEAGPVSVDVVGSTASVDIGGGVLESGRSDQVLALAQVVVTLDALPQVDAVRFLSEGQVLPVPRADGAISEDPLTADDYRPLLAPPP